VGGTQNVSFLGRRYFKLPILSCPRIPSATQARSTSAGPGMFFLGNYLTFSVALWLVCSLGIVEIFCLQWRKSWWGGGGATATPPSRKMTNFQKFCPKIGLKTAFSSANGGVCRKFESFVGNLGGFAPPPHRKK
jgi:hypothetical protein